MRPDLGQLANDLRHMLWRRTTGALVQAVNQAIQVAARNEFVLEERRVGAQVSVEQLDDAGVLRAVHDPGKQGRLIAQGTDGVRIKAELEADRLREIAISRLPDFAEAASLTRSLSASWGSAAGETCREPSASRKRPKAPAAAEAAGR
jgi:hypothetical protein